MKFIVTFIILLFSLNCFTQSQNTGKLENHFLSGFYLEGSFYNDIVPNFSVNIDAPKSQLYYTDLGYSFNFQGYSPLTLDVSGRLMAERFSEQLSPDNTGQTVFSWGINISTRWYPWKNMKKKKW